MYHVIQFAKSEAKRLHYTKELNEGEYNAAVKNEMGRLKRYLPKGKQTTNDEIEHLLKGDYRLRG